MSSKRSNSSRSGKPSEVDDLTLITGIGPAVESRLHGVGIYTFAQLAALSPADIAASVSGLAGLTAERIIKQDWIGQAHKLAAPTTLSQPDWIEQARHLSANGTITGQKDDTENSVKNQHILIATNEPHENLEVEVQKVASASASGAKKNLLSVLHLGKIETMAVGAESPRCLLPSGQPFDVLLTLDFTGIALPNDAPLNYTTRIHAKKLGDHSSQPVGEAHGSIIPSEKVSIRVEGTTLVQGIYRLEAAVTLTSTDEEALSYSDLTAQMKGRVLQVY